MKRTTHGFTLLEVLVAISILGLGLTVILSSQVGLFSSAARSENLTHAVGLARCRMAETELELKKNGYPLLDQTEDGPCCEDEDTGRYTCEWKVDKVELPQASAIAGDGGIPTDEATAGPLGAIGALGADQGGGPILGSDGGLGGIADMMGGGAAATGDLAGMVMGMVYPDLKLMLEASIRRVTVTVRWKEGSNDRQFAVSQYVTDPQQGGIDQNAMTGVNQALEQLDNVGQPGAQSPAPSTSSQGSRP